MFEVWFLFLYWSFFEFSIQSILVIIDSEKKRQKVKVKVHKHSLLKFDPDTGVILILY